jgi:hypothetical protein
MTVPELRPRTSSELVDATFQLARAHYVPLLVLSAILAAPSLVVSVLAHQVIVGMTVVGATGRFGGTSDVGAQIATGVALVVAYLWYCVIDGAIIWYAAQAYLGQPVEPGVAVRRALDRAGRLIGTNLLRLLYLGLGSLVPLFFIGILAGVLIPRGVARQSAAAALFAGLAVLAIFVFVMGWVLFMFARYVIAPAVVMLEERGAVGALRRSAELMVGARRRTAVTFIVVGAIYVALLLLVTVPLGLLKSTAVSALASTMVRAALYPLFASLVTLIYYDRRVKKEAYDIELMSGSLGAAPGGLPGTVPGTDPAWPTA